MLAKTERVDELPEREVSLTPYVLPFPEVPRISHTKGCLVTDLLCYRGLVVSHFRRPKVLSLVVVSPLPLLYVCPNYVLLCQSSTAVGTAIYFVVRKLPGRHVGSVCV